MSIAHVDPYETDEERQAREEREAAATQNREAFERRKSEREAKAREAEETAAELAKVKRELAMRDVLPTLNAQGPLNAFLRHYDGEPTADAIRTAVAADDDFKTLITFPPDPRDEAATQQWDNAQKAQQGAPLGKTQPDVGPGVGRLRVAYDTKTT